jgi:hypothetical protein
MDPAFLITAMVGAQTGSVQSAMATKMMKMNADAEASLAQMIDSASQNLMSLANVGPGVGQNLNITA